METKDRARLQLCPVPSWTRLEYIAALNMMPSGVLVGDEFPCVPSVKDMGCIEV